MDPKFKEINILGSYVFGTYHGAFNWLFKPEPIPTNLREASIYRMKGQISPEMFKFYMEKFADD